MDPIPQFLDAHDKEYWASFWAYNNFGPNAVDKIERSRRVIEECLELVQAVGLAKEEAVKILDHVYSQEPGRKDHELGDTLFVLYALAYSLQLSTAECSRHAFHRANAKTPDYWKARHENKKGLGLSE